MRGIIMHNLHQLLLRLLYWQDTSNYRKIKSYKILVWKTVLRINKCKRQYNIRVAPREVKVEDVS